MKKILRKAAASALSIAMVSVQATAFVGGAGILSMVSPMTVMAEETVTAYWDFKTTGARISVAIVNTTDTVSASNTTGYNLTVNATNGKFDSENRAKDSDVQINSGTVVQIPVKNAGDKIVITPNGGNYDFTIGGEKAVASDGKITYTAQMSDVYNGYVEMVAKGTTYLYRIDLYEQSTLNSVLWNVAGYTLSENMVLQEGSTTSSANYALEVNSNTYTMVMDATNGKIGANTAQWAQFNKGAVLRIPVCSAGDTIKVKAYSGSAYTIGGKPFTGDETAQEYTISKEGYDTAIKQGYIDIISTSDNGYIGSVELDTYGVPGTTSQSEKEGTTSTVSGTLTNIDSSDKAYIVFDGGGSSVYSVISSTGTYSVELTKNVEYSVGIYGGNSAYIPETNKFTPTQSAETFSPDITVVVQSAADTATEHTYMFNDGTVMPKITGIGYTSFTTKDGAVNMTATNSFSYHDNQHGISDRGVAYKFNVNGDCNIVFICCQHGNAGNFSATCSAEGATVTPTSASTQAASDGDTVTFVYKGGSGTVTVTTDSSGKYMHGVKISPLVETVSNVYVGDNTHTPNYSTIAEAVSAVNNMPGTDEVTINVAAGTYDIGTTPLALTRANVKISGASSQSSIIKSSINGATATNDTSGSGTLHSGTLILRGNNATLENITVQNTHQNDNSSALEIYSTGNVIQNSVIDAYRDTLYTSLNSSSAFTGTVIKGWQDVIYGGGTHSFTGCTFENNGIYDTRFFAPTGTDSAPYSFTSTNCTLSSSVATNGNIYLARPWHGSNSSGKNGVLKITNLTIGESAKTGFNNAKNTQGLYGFDKPSTQGTNDTGETSENCRFFVSFSNESNIFYTSYSALNKATAAIAIDINDLKIVGTLDPDVYDLSSDISKIGFIASNNSEKVEMLTDTIYHIGDNYYTVAFAEEVTSLEGINFVPALNYDNMTIVGTVTTS